MEDTVYKSEKRESWTPKLQDRESSPGDMDRAFYKEIKSQNISYNFVNFLFKNN